MTTKNPMDSYGAVLNNAANLQKMHGDLKIILENELQAGNLVCDSTVDDDGTVLIALKYPFRTPIQNLPNIEFAVVDNPKIWHSEYHDKINKIMLVCYHGGENITRRTL